jgi:hypothetical protein
MHHGDQIVGTVSLYEELQAGSDRIAAGDELLRRRDGGEGFGVWTIDLFSL